MLQRHGQRAPDERTRVDRRTNEERRRKNRLREREREQVSCSPAAFQDVSTYTTGGGGGHSLARQGRSPVGWWLQAQREWVQGASTQHGEL